jgi:hypothetical protein
MVRKSGYKYLKLVHGVLCRKVPAETVEMQWTYVTDHVNDVNSGGSEAEISRRSWIQIILHRHCILAANRGYMLYLYNC